MEEPEKSVRYRMKIKQPPTMYKASDRGAVRFPMPPPLAPPPLVPSRMLFSPSPG